MRTQSAALAALCLVSGTAFAEGPIGSVDVYYVPTAHVEASVTGLGSDSDHGDGFGARGMVRAEEWLAFTGEYQAVSYDDFGDLNQYRVGAGLVGESGSGLFVEYIATEDALEATGFGVHARLSGRNVYGQFGYVQLDDDDFDDELTGFEWTLGIVVPVGEKFSVFADVRRTGLGRDGSDFELETADVRAGVRIGF